eukprot:11298003-Ditylum_brightwellii.AAC.1
MDNLFNSIRFSVVALNYCPKKVLTQGVIRASGRGVPLCVLQEVLSGKRAEEACSTVKAAVLK